MLWKKSSYKSCLKYKQIHYGNINKLINKFFKFNLLIMLLKLLISFLYIAGYIKVNSMFSTKLFISRNHQFIDDIVTWGS